jgi:hypothetical protein
MRGRVSSRYRLTHFLESGSIGVIRDVEDTNPFFIKNL